MKRSAKPEGKFNVVIEEVPIPEPGPEQVRIRSVTSLISRGSEIGARYTREHAVNPESMGYSLAGVVDAVGAEVTHLRPGDRVVSLAPHAEYVVRDAVYARPDAQNQVYPIADGVSFEQATYWPLLAGGVTWVDIEGLGPRRPRRGGRPGPRRQPDHAGAEAQWHRHDRGHRHAGPALRDGRQAGRRRRDQRGQGRRRGGGAAPVERRGGRHGGVRRGRLGGTASLRAGDGHGRPRRHAASGRTLRGPAAAPDLGRGPGSADYRRLLPARPRRGVGAARHGVCSRPGKSPPSA